MGLEQCGKRISHPLVYGGMARFAGQNRGDSKIDDAMLSLTIKEWLNISPVEWTLPHFPVTV